VPQLLHKPGCAGLGLRRVPNLQESVLCEPTTANPLVSHFCQKVDHIIWKVFKIFLVFSVSSVGDIVAYSLMAFCGGPGRFAMVEKPLRPADSLAKRKKRPSGRALQAIPRPLASDDVQGRRMILTVLTKKHKYCLQRSRQSFKINWHLMMSLNKQASQRCRERA